MAEDTATDATAPKTEYRVLRKLAGDALEEAKVDGDEAAVYELLPETFTGNVKRAVYEKHGEGDYVKIAARSFDEFPARKKEVVTFK